MSGPVFAAVDDDTASLLELLESDWRPFAQRDWNTVAQAIRDDALDHGGKVSPNRVRRTLAALPVFDQPKPQRVGPVYRALCVLGVLRVATTVDPLTQQDVPAYELSDDTAGKNAGKPHRSYIWVGDGQ